MRQQALFEYFFTAQAVAAMHQRHAFGKIGQKQCFLNRRIAAADNHDFFIAVEKPVTCRTGRDTKALKLGLRIKAEPFGLRASGDNHRICGIDLSAVAGQPERALR